MMRILIRTALAAMAISACSDSAGAKPDAGAASKDADADAAVFDTGAELLVTVPESGRVYARLSPPSVVTPAADPKTSLDWDVAFEGFDVFTNGGASGSGKGSAFGPLDAITFLGEMAPAVPFLTEDKAGGAFLEWYAYEGTTHALFCRYHVYGVREGARLWKVQVLGYYGQRDGAAISALYKIRYAELASGVAPVTQELSDLDGTAGGLSASASAPSECLDLGTGVRTMLTPDAARASSAWHLCFRRDSIGVNGETGGPRGITAVDLGAEATVAETVDAVKARSAEGEKASFDAATVASFDGKTFRGDRVVSAFGDRWIVAEGSPLVPTSAAWLVQDAAGRQTSLLGFTEFRNPTTKSPGTVVMRVKPVKK